MNMIPPRCTCDEKVSLRPCLIHGTLGRKGYGRQETSERDSVLQVGTSGGLSCPTMEDCQYVQWLAGDKALLAAALKEIYNIRGEDEEIAKIVNEALDRGSAT